jgi:uncharacterized protein YyaL (SSP411 family)
MPTDPDAPRTAAPRRSNRLAGETSPYLLQHAHNPVDWYPWGPEALARAQETDRPIFLSIGYAACHWCHVMERESFEDEATAADLNASFVAIKVDREERPDLDAIYMDAVQAMTGHGGWPMSVFLTPDGRPFYGGTYFPDRPRHGMPSFRQVLARIGEVWRDDRAEVEASATRLADHVRTAQASPTAPASALEERPESDPTSVLVTATAALESSFDARNGGWGGAPKFPQPMTIGYLLREHLRTRDARPLAIARRTLDAMADGGIYDHLGGGFARYATDAIWLVPHFEKMLYDNAQLSRVYVEAWQVTGDDHYAQVARETLDFMARELRVPADGAFASSLDADTGGEEGVTYTWTADEVRALLGPDAALIEAAYDVTDEGNWEGRTILRRVADATQLAAGSGASPAEVEARLVATRALLHDARDRRPQPGRDDKVLTSWNGLAIAAFADAGRALGDERYTDIAAEAARFVLHALRAADGRLLRSWKDGRAQHAGVLEDHAHLADGLLALYAATFDERWFEAARDLMDVVLARFEDEDGGFHDTADDAEALIARPRGLQDNAIPSGGAMATHVLLRLSALTGEGRYRDAAERALAPMGLLLARHPTAFAMWLQAQQLACRPIAEVAIVGDPADAATQSLTGAAFRDLGLGRVVAASAAPQQSAIALLHDRDMVEGQPTAYVCQAFACRLPVTTPEALADLLRAAA